MVREETKAISETLRLSKELQKHLESHVNNGAATVISDINHVGRMVKEKHENFANHHVAKRVREDLRLDVSRLVCKTVSDVEIMSTDTRKYLRRLTRCLERCYLSKQTLVKMSEVFDFGTEPLRISGVKEAVTCVGDLAYRVRQLCLSDNASAVFNTQVTEAIRGAKSLESEAIRAALSLRHYGGVYFVGKGRATALRKRVDKMEADLKRLRGKLDDKSLDAFRDLLDGIRRAGGAHFATEDFVARELKEIDPLVALVNDANSAIERVSRLGNEVRGAMSLLADAANKIRELVEMEAELIGEAADGRRFAEAMDRVLEISNYKRMATEVLNLTLRLENSVTYNEERMAAKEKVREVTVMLEGELERSLGAETETGE